VNPEFADIYQVLAPGIVAGSPQDLRTAVEQEIDDHWGLISAGPGVAPLAPPADLPLIITTLAASAAGERTGRYSRAHIKHNFACLISIAKMGAITDTKAENIRTQIREEHRVSLDYSPDDYQHGSKTWMGFRICI
jgi:hypothetical protein